MWIEVRTMQGKLLIGNVYKPPNCGHFWASFEANVVLVKSKCNNAQLLILGNLNAEFQTINGKKLVDMCITVLETHFEKLLSRRVSKLKKLLVLLKSSLPSDSRVQGVMLHWKEGVIIETE